MLNKNTWGAKKCEANQKQHIANRHVELKNCVTLPKLFLTS